MPEQENNSTNSDEQTEIKRLLKENQEYLKAIYKSTEKTRKYILIGRIISVIYLLFIIIPLILAAIYIPPLLKPYLLQYQTLMNTSQSLPNIEVSPDLLDQLKGLKNIYR